MALSFGIPTIAAIQRTNALITAVLVAILVLARMSAIAFGCALGSAIVIVNLYLLAILGRVLISAADAQGSSRLKLGVLVLPVKLLVYAGVIYLAVGELHVEAGGFGLGFGGGVLTEFIAIAIETGRASVRGAIT